MTIRRLSKLFFKFLAAILLLFFALLFALYLPATQRWLTPKLETWLAKKLNTHLKVEGIGVRFPKSLEIKGFEIWTPAGDSLLQVGRLVVDMDMWALMDNKVVLQAVTLENASAHLRQENGIANFDFILEAFAPIPDSTNKPVAKTENGIQISIDGASLSLKNVAFDWKDLDNQRFANAVIGGMNLKVESGELQTTKFQIETLSLSNAVIAYRDLGPPAPDSLAAPTVFDVLVKAAEFENSELQFETALMKFNADLTQTELGEFTIKSGEAGFGIEAETFKLTDSGLSFFQKNTVATPGRFNATDFDLKKLNAQFSDFSFQNDSLSLDIQALSGTEKSGMDLRKLTGQLSYSPTDISLQNLDLQSNSTNLKGDFYIKTDGAGKNPLTRFEAKLGRSSGVVADLLRFLPNTPALAGLEKMGNTNWAIEGSLRGNLDALEANGFRFIFGKNTHLYASGTLRQFSQPAKLGGNLQITELKFDKDDFTPFLKGKNMVLPAFAQLTGKVAGNNGVLRLQLKGSMGNLDSLAYAPVVSDTAHFDLAGTISGLTNAKSFFLDLDINRLDAPGRQFANFVPKNITLPDRMSAKGKLKGNMAKLYSDLRLGSVRKGASSNMDVTGWLTQLDNPDKLGFDLTYAGKLSKQELTGFMPDSLLKRYLDLPDFFSLNGKAKGQPKDLLVAANLDLGSQGSLAIDASLKGEKYNAKIAGKSLKINEIAADSLLPQLKLINLTATLDGDGFGFGETANAKLEGQIQSLTWEDKTFENLLLNADLKGKSLDFAMNSPDPKLQMDLTGNLNFGVKTPLLNWTATFNCIDFQSLGLARKKATACFEIKGDLAGLSMDTMDAKLQLSHLNLQLDSTQITPSDVAISASLHNQNNEITVLSDWLNISIDGHFDFTTLPNLADAFSQHYFKTKAGDTKTTKAGTTDKLQFKMMLDQPALAETGIVPGLTALGKLEMEGQFDMSTKVFNFTTSLPSASYDGWAITDLKMVAEGDGKNANSTLKIPVVEQNDVTFVRGFRFTTMLDGQKADALLVALDSLGKERYKIGFYAETGDFVDGYALHFAPAQTINYDNWTIPKDNSLRLDSSFVSIKNLHLVSGEQSLKIEGATNLRRGKSPELDFSLVIQHVKLSNFEPFVIGVLSKMEGWLDADIQLGGTVKAPKPAGKLSFNQAKTTVEMTKVRYALSDKTFELTKQGIDFSGLRLTDPRGKSLTINGLLKTEDWVDFRYDWTLTSRDIMIMNTQKSAGAVYFGKLIAKVDGTVRGQLAQPYITLSASPVSGSEINYIYDAALNQSQGNGLVVFTKPKDGRGKRIKESSKRYPFYLNLNLDLTDALLLNVVTDPSSGDNFSGNLDGRLSLEIFPDGKMNLAGRADITKGTYLFTYQQLVKRVFKVTPPSYLAWTGDPFNPELNITARFVVRTSPYPLLAATQPSDEPGLRDYQTFFLNFFVTGEALSPVLKINLEYPDNDALAGENISNSGNDAITSAVASINADEAALSQQVFGLLITQQFFGTKDDMATADQSLVGKRVTNFLTNNFNALADRYLKFVDLSLEVSEDAVLGADNQYVGSTNYNLKLQKTFFNDRLIFKVSGVTTEERGASESGLSSSLNNASVEFLFTPSGVLKIRAFTEEGIEIFGNDATRNSGSGIIFTKEYKRLFKRKK